VDRLHVVELNDSTGTRLQAKPALVRTRASRAQHTNCSLPPDGQGEHTIAPGLGERQYRFRGEQSAAKQETSSH